VDIREITGADIAETIDDPQLFLEQSRLSNPENSAPASQWELCRDCSTAVGECIEETPKMAQV
jgi:hypothetical protein